MKQKGSASIHLVPYSEHSSYGELLEYVGFLRPHQVIPTVGGDTEASLRKIQAHFRHLVDETAQKAGLEGGGAGVWGMTAAASMHGPRGARLRPNDRSGTPSACRAMGVWVTRGDPRR